MPSSTITHSERSAWESSSGLFQPSRPPNLAGWHRKVSVLPSLQLESFPQHWLQGGRPYLHRLSLDSRPTGPVPATQRQALVQRSDMRLRRFDVRRPGSIRCKWRSLNLSSMMTQGPCKHISRTTSNILNIHSSIGSVRPSVHTSAEDDSFVH